MSCVFWFGCKFYSKDYSNIFSWFSSLFVLPRVVVFHVVLHNSVEGVVCSDYECCMCVCLCEFVKRIESTASASQEIIGNGFCRRASSSLSSSTRCPHNMEGVSTCRMFDRLPLRSFNCFCLLCVSFHFASTTIYLTGLSNKKSCVFGECIVCTWMVMRVCVCAVCKCIGLYNLYQNSIQALWIFPRFRSLIAPFGRS